MTREPQSGRVKLNAIEKALDVVKKRGDLYTSRSYRKHSAAKKKTKAELEREARLLRRMLRNLQRLSAECWRRIDAAQWSPAGVASVREAAELLWKASRFDIDAALRKAPMPRRKRR